MVEGRYAGVVEGRYAGVVGARGRSGGGLGLGVVEG